MARFTEPSTQEILTARRLKHQGASLQEIQTALGWDCAPKTTQARLLRGGLKVRVSQTGRRAHYGDNTTTCEDWYDKAKARKTQEA